MLIAMVVIFGTSWFPINLINLVGDLINLGSITLVNIVGDLINLGIPHQPDHRSNQPTYR